MLAQTLGECKPGGGGVLAPSATWQTLGLCATHSRRLSHCRWGRLNVGPADSAGVTMVVGLGLAGPRDPAASEGGPARPLPPLRQFGATTMAANSVATTFPALLWANATESGATPAYREKEFGIWKTWTWAEVAEQVRYLALGLRALGLERGDRFAIIGDNRPHLYWSFTAGQSIGAIPVPCYQDSVADEIAYVCEHAGVRVAVVEDQEQVDKLLEARDRLPGLQAIVYTDSRGLERYDGVPGLTSFDSVIRSGKGLHNRDPEDYQRELARGRPTDIAAILYTSGTTGRPKGVLLTHANLIEPARRAVKFDNLTERDEVLAYLPMAWVGDFVFSIAQCQIARFCVNCPESPETVLTDLREIGPTYFFAPPRIFENMLTSLMVRMENAAWIKRRLFSHFLGVARRVGCEILDGKPVGWFQRLHYVLGNLLIYGPLRDVLGLGRVRVAYTAGEAIGPDVFRFYRSLGINLKQLYGQTEASVYVSIQSDAEASADTVGPAFPGVEVRIQDQEVQFRSDGVFQGYYRDDEATAKTKTEDGFVRSGDAGYIDGAGHLRIVDRAKDVGALNDGTLFAPKFIENKLKFHAPIREAVAFGDGRDAVCCMINIDLEAVGDWAERRGIAYSGYTDLARQSEVHELVREAISKVNTDLSADPALCGSQIRRFLILHKELDADDGELTRTRKVRRTVIGQNYGDLVEALYDGRESCQVVAEVTFEDGRRGTIEAEVKIWDVAPEAPPVAAAA